MTINGKKITFKITTPRLILMALSGLFFVTALTRLFLGLGAITNLNDAWPWGVWILVDVKLGVALAAGGFTVAGLYYIFGVKVVKPVVKAAVLTAWLGYSLVGLGLLLDLGLWYRFWHPIVDWGHHSVMFELYWCVLLYTIVLTGEFAPTLLERIGFNRSARILTAMTVPLIIGGIVLSTLHQSSLGSMYILMFGKLDPLWWSMLLPVLYFASAVAVGPAMVICETDLACRMLGHEWSTKTMEFLSKFAGYTLTIYFVTRVADLFMRGEITGIFHLKITSFMFLLEIVAGSIIPLTIFWGSRLRKAIQTRGQIVVQSALIVTGVVLHRANIVFTGMAESSNGSYFPSFGELAILIGLTSTGVLAYLFIVENTDVFPSHEQEAAVETSSDAA